MEHNAEHRQRIVVGVDGSTGSKTALRWAMTQAQLIGATVEAVNAWQDPAMFEFAYGWAPLSIDGGTIPTFAKKTLDETVAEVANQLGTHASVVTRAIQGHPAQVLLSAATGAQLLVVGSRGHGSFAGLLLGSVSQLCVQHAPCPVVVVPQQRSFSTQPDVAAEVKVGAAVDTEINVGAAAGADASVPVGRV